MDKIKFEKRELTGKKAKRVLADGFMPSVVYNSKGESVTSMIELSLAKQIVASASSTALLDIEVNGKDKKVVLKEIDRNPRTGDARHLSFFEIDADKEMAFTIPFEVDGVAPAVKNNLGVLVKALQSIDVRCKPADLVDSIKIDITELEHPGQNILVSDIELPKGMSLPNDDLLSTAIVAISEVQKEEIVEEVDEEGLEGEEGEESAEGEEGKEGAEGEEAKEEAKE